MTSTKVQSGRTIIETLGMLAVIGIITVVSVKLFNSAMTQHRANELMNEANKRAVSVAAQIVAGKNKSDLSVDEFPNTNGYTFGVEADPTNADRFNLTVDAVDVDACKRLKTMIGPYTALRSISTDCTILTFNDDLSREAKAADYDINSAACTEAGYKWCTYGDDGVASKCFEDPSTNCCAHANYDTQCQSCNAAGYVSNKGNTTVCYFNNDQNKPSKCNTGVCMDPDITNNSVCTSNADCGGVGSGYYCKITYKAADNLNSSLNGKMNTTETACFHDLKGTCVVAPRPTRLTQAQKEFLNQAGFPATTIFSPSLNWWSAKNWCEAQGKQLFDISEMGCHRRVDNTLVEEGQSSNAYCCKDGQTCQQGNWNSSLWNGKNVLPGKAGEVAKFADKMVALRKSFGATYFWTSSAFNGDTDNLCYAFFMHANYGQANYNGRNNGYYAMCK